MTAHLVQSLHSPTLGPELDAAHLDGTLVGAWRLDDGREVLATPGRIAVDDAGTVYRGAWPAGVSARVAVQIVMGTVPGEDPVMKGLSVRQPWAILHLGKGVENRDWSNAPGLVAQALRLRGQELLLHAGLGCTRAEYHDAWTWMAGQGLIESLKNHRAPRLPPLAELPRGALVARARLVDVVRTMPGGHRFDLDGVRCLRCGAIPASGAPPCPKADPWAIPGWHGLLLADVVALPAPIPLKARLGFFEVPDHLLARGAAHA